MKLKATIVCIVDEVRQQIRPDDPRLEEKLEALNDDQKTELIQAGLIIDDGGSPVVIDGEIDPDGEDVVVLDKTETPDDGDDTKPATKKPATKKPAKAQD